jgi:hypothetical protein
MLAIAWSDESSGCNRPSCAPAARQLGIIIFFTGLLLSWGSSWSPRQARPLSPRVKGSPDREVWDEDESGEEQGAEMHWPDKEGAPRPRRESLWEEAEIDGLDVTERTPRWDGEGPDGSFQPTRFLPVGHGHGHGHGHGSSRRASAMSLLDHILGHDAAREDGRDEDPVSPRARADSVSVATGTGGAAHGSGGKAVRRFSQEHCPGQLTPPQPPDGPV